MRGQDPAGNLDRYAKSLLHGKCYDRWEVCENASVPDWNCLSCKILATQCGGWRRRTVSDEVKPLCRCETLFSWIFRPIKTKHQFSSFNSRSRHAFSFCLFPLVPQVVWQILLHCHLQEWEERAERRALLGRRADSCSPLGGMCLFVCVGRPLIVSEACFPVP